MKLQQEILYQIKGGIAIGKNRLLSWKASWPNAELIVYANGIVLDVPWSKVTFSKEDIDEITWSENMFRASVQFIYHNSKQCKYVKFFIIKKDRIKLLELMDVLKATGYTITISKESKLCKSIFQENSH